MLLVEWLVLCLVDMHRQEDQGYILLTLIIHTSSHHTCKHRYFIYSIQTIDSVMTTIHSASYTLLLSLGLSEEASYGDGNWEPLLVSSGTKKSIK